MTTPSNPTGAQALSEAAEEAVKWLNSWFRNHDGNKIADKLSAALAGQEQAGAVAETEKKTHGLKTDPDVFDAVWNGLKTFEIRFNDRDFKVGDWLNLHETKHSGEDMKAGLPLIYTGRSMLRKVSHVLSGYGLAEGWVCLSLAAPGAAIAAREQEALPSHQEMAVLMGSASRGSMCPLCGWDTPHQHSPEEIIIYRNGVKWGRNNGKEQWTGEVRPSATQNEPSDAIRVGRPMRAPANQHHEHRAGQSDSDRANAAGNRGGDGVHGDSGLQEEAVVESREEAPATPPAATPAAPGEVVTHTCDESSECGACDKASGKWMLIAPDGQRWSGETKLQCLSAETKERVPATVQLERIFAAAYAERDDVASALMDAVEQYQFECQGGSLENCTHWQELRNHVNGEQVSAQALDPTGHSSRVSAALSNPAPIAAPAQTAVNAIAALAPVELKNFPYAGRFRCQQCRFEWGGDLGSEGHAVNCAYAIATSVPHTLTAAPAPASEAVAWECRKRVPNNPTWSEWTSCLERDHVAIQTQSLHWGMVYQSRALCLATPSPGDSADAPVQQAGEAEAKAKKLYAKHTDNHPTIHCNRFPAWDELSATERDKWRAKARAALKGEQPAQTSGSERGEV